MSEVKVIIEFGERTIKALDSFGERIKKMESRKPKGKGRQKIVKLSQIGKNDVVDLENLPEDHKVDLVTAGKILGYVGKSKSTLRRYQKEGLYLFSAFSTPAV